MLLDDTEKTDEITKIKCPFHDWQTLPMRNLEGRCLSYLEPLSRNCHAPPAMHLPLCLKPGFAAHFVWLGLEAEGLFPGVYCSNMGGECPCVCKAPSTLITRKRPLPSVLVQMGFQTSFLEEAFATFRTREGLLLSIVCEQMDPQTSPCAEALVTLWTLEGLLPTVDPRVFSEPILLSVGLPTLLTHEGLLAPV